MTQKQERAAKLVDEVKTAVVHKLPQKEKSAFAVLCGRATTDFRKSSDTAHLVAAAKKFRAEVTPYLKRVPDATADSVKSSLWRLDQAVGGRK